MYFFTLFSGETALASIELVIGVAYSVGNFSDCDIVIQEEQNGPFSFSITLLDNQVQFSALSSKIIDVHGNSVTNGALYILPQAFQLGDYLNCTFSIYPQTENVLSYIALQQLLPQKVATNSISPNIEQDIFAEPILDPSEITLKMEQDGLGTAKEELKKGISRYWHYWAYKLKGLRPKTGTEYIVYSALGLFILAIITVAIIYSLGQKSGLSNHEILSVDKKFNQLAKIYPDLFLAKQGQEQFIISGIVNNESDLNLIKHKFNHDRIIYNVLTNAVIDKQIKELNLGDNIQLFYKPKTIYAVGILSNNNMLADIYDTLSNKFPVDIEIDTSRLYPINQVESDIMLINNNPDLNMKLLITPDLIHRTVMVGGYLSDHDKETLDNIIKVLQAKYNGLLNFKLDIRGVSKLNLVISEVYVDSSQSYIIVNDKDKVFVGGMIGELRLQSVELDQIILKNIKTAYPLVINFNQLATKSTDNNVLVSTATPLNDAVNEDTLNPVFIEEKKHLEEERQYREDLESAMPYINNPNVKKFMEKQVRNLNDDLIAKERELNYYVNKKN